MPYDRKLVDHAPSYYAELRESDELFSAEDAEFARLRTSIDELLRQFNVSTATWGLREWERICGIATDERKSDEERRAGIIAKLRGTVPATKETLLSVMKAYTQSENNEVVTLNAEYVVRYIADASDITDFTALMEALRTYTPAHLAIEAGTQTITANSTATAANSGMVTTIYPLD